MAESGMQPALWEEAGRRIESAIGLNFGARPASELRRAVRSAAEQLGFRDSGAFVAHLLARPLDAQERAALAKCLAIGETYFFRDPLLFDCLGTQVLPPLIQARRGGERRLRLWSAACSTGEEPYSLAMLVASVLPDWPQWDIRILASDLNAAALDKARAGVYGRWSLRGGMPAAARPFLRKPAADRYEVAPEIRGLVRFASMNLVEDAFPSAADGMAAMDVILCRNVLIYFEPRRGQAVLERLGRCLGPQGWLFTSPIEVPTAPVAGLERARLGSVPALRRSTGGDAAAAPKALLPLPVPTASPAAPPRRPARHAASGRQRAAPPVEAPATETAAPACAAQPAGAGALGRDARAEADAGRLEHAEALCRQAIEQDKLDPQWPYLLGTILLERGADAPAAEALRRTLYLQPRHVPARLSLATLELRRGASAAGRKHLALAQAQLAGHAPDEVVPGSGGVRAAELGAVIRRLRDGA